jgi:CMP-N-acetylneuraminate monooxygenase
MGFRNVVPLDFGSTIDLAPGVQLTTIEPAGVWNDAIFLMEVGGFRILNLNDAGINRSIPERLGPVDLVAAQFSVGASGYPWTWDHIADEEKVSIMQRARQGRLEMLNQIIDLYQAKYLLPFASHFALWHPSHRAFNRLLPRVTFADVRARIGDKATVLDLLPGSKWDARTGSKTGVYSESQWLNVNHTEQFVVDHFDEKSFQEIFADTPRLDRQALIDYLLRLNETPEMTFCEDMHVLLILVPDHSDEAPARLAFEISGGRLQISAREDNPNLTMKISERMMSKIVREDASWDELHVGYWGNFQRSPDVYTPGFWRMLQAPYYRRRLLESAAPVNPAGPVNADSVVAQLVESHGEHVSRIMRRYGLYCAGCHRSTYETLATAGRQHGLSDARVSDLVLELREVCR